MEKFNSISSVVAPLDRANVDTDAIIPKQFLKSIKRSGFGPNLFDEWRYLDHGEPGMDNSKRAVNSDFVLNKPAYQGTQILLARENFGCGSSREHAPWALLDFGIRVVIAPSFADIFYNNCFKNGILPVILSDAQVDELFADAAADEAFALTVDLPSQRINSSSDRSYDFDIDAFRKHCLINGLDDIGLTLQHVADIKNYEEKARLTTPWLFSEQKAD